MMVMTAKLNFKKIMMLLGTVFALILAAVLLMGGGEESETSSAPSMAGNPERVQFLTDMGWEVKPQPVEACQVKMPKEVSPVYDRYNNLQKSQGYDLTDYAGKKAMRYVYEISNYPGAKAPVYGTLLIWGDKIIGGDVTDTGAGGKIRGLRNPNKQAQVPAPSETQPETAPETQPSEETQLEEAPQ